MKAAGLSRFVLLVLLSGAAFACASCSVRAGETDTMVERYLAARRGNVQLVPLSEEYGLFSLEAAYYVQESLARQVVALDGPVVGYKVAYASEAARKQFNIPEPARGPLFAAQRVPNGSTLPANVFQEITLETEIAFTIGRRIDRPVKDVNELRRYVRWVHVAFDAGNFPYNTADVSATPADMIAIGTGAYRFVVGPAFPAADVDIDDIPLTLSRNGERLRDSSTKEVLGSPWNSLLWCANHLNGYGLTLEPGMVVLTGTAAPAYRERGEAIRGRYEGEAGPLGKISLTLK